MEESHSLGAANCNHPHVGSQSSGISAHVHCEEPEGSGPRSSQLGAYSGGSRPAIPQSGVRMNEPTHFDLVTIAGGFADRFRGVRRLSDATPVRTRLAAGGNRIRTVGPAGTGMVRSAVWSEAKGMAAL